MAKAKFKVGDHVLCAYTNLANEISIYDDYISEVSFNEQGVVYYLRNFCDDDMYFEEKELVEYGDTQKLLQIVINLIKEAKENNEDKVIPMMFYY